MRRLGEILLDWGALAVSELHTGLEACHRSGGRLGTHLLKFGYVDEHQLLDALSEQYGFKPVSSAVLARARPDVVSMIPANHARRLQAVPFQLRDDRLMVAMTNPRDAVGIEEIAEMTGMTVQPFVATETAIIGVIDSLVAEVEPGPRPAPDGAKADGWDGWWNPPRLTPTELLVRRPQLATRPPRKIEVSTFPELAPVEQGGSLGAEPTLDEATYRKLMSAAEHRDEVGRLVVRYLAGFFSRVCLFAVHRGAVVGWMARGRGVVVDDVQSFSVRLESESLFHEFRNGAGYHLGPIPGGAEDEDLVRMFGDPVPVSVLMLPIRIKDRAVAFVMGDNPNEEIATIPVDEVAASVAAAGLALEVLILKKKILG